MTHVQSESPFRDGIIDDVCANKVDLQEGEELGGGTPSLTLVSIDEQKKIRFVTRKRHHRERRRKWMRQRSTEILVVVPVEGDRSGRGKEEGGWKIAEKEVNGITSLGLQT